MGDVLNSENMQTLATLVEEAMRSTKEGVKYFVEPAPGTLRRATTKRHHIVFGRRGSGKSSLLRKAGADLTLSRRPIAHVDLETFKGHSYPDVLLSVLIATFVGFRTWINTAAIHPATRKRFWNRLFGTTPSCASYNRKACSELSDRLANQISQLEQQLHASDEAEIQKTTEEQCESQQTGQIEAGVSGIVAAKGKATVSEANQQTEEVQESFRRSKIDFLHRHILDYQRIFGDMGNLSNGDSYLFLDDLYHIKRQDQANVVDYFHRVAKGQCLWLKIGTIRHRTSWYVHGDPPTGVKLGDDADAIDLDLTLEKYDLAREFLKKILTNFSKVANLQPIGRFLTDGAVDRLVLASGGVARDFLSVFRRSIDIARQRRGGGRAGPRIGAEDVNMAAGEHDTSKREEFKLDSSEDAQGLDAQFTRIRDFCLERANYNCFLVYKDAKGEEVDAIHELVDLKLLHLVSKQASFIRVSCYKVGEFVWA